MQVTIEQAVKEAVDFPKAKGRIPPSSSGPANHGCIREIRDLTAPGTNQ